MPVKTGPLTCLKVPDCQRAMSMEKKQVIDICKKIWIYIYIHMCIYIYIFLHMCVYYIYIYMTFMKQCPRDKAVIIFSIG